MDFITDLTKYIECVIIFVFRSDPIESLKFEFDEGLLCSISGDLQADTLQINSETHENLKTR